MPVALALAPALWWAGWLLLAPSQGAFGPVDALLGLRPALAVAVASALLALLVPERVSWRSWACRCMAALVAASAAAMLAPELGLFQAPLLSRPASGPSGVAGLLGPMVLVVYLLSLAAAIGAETVARPAIAMALQALGGLATGVCMIGWLLLAIGAREFGSEVVARLAPGWGVLTLVAAGWNARSMSGPVRRAFVKDRPDRVALLRSLLALAIAILTAGLAGTGIFAIQLAETIRPLLQRGAGAHAAALTRQLDHRVREAATAAKHARAEAPAEAAEAAMREVLAPHGPPGVRVAPAGAPFPPGVLPLRNAAGVDGWIGSVDGASVGIVMPLPGRSETVRIAFADVALLAADDSPILGTQAETLLCVPGPAPASASCLTPSGLVTMPLPRREDGRRWPMESAWKGESGVMLTLDRFGDGVAVGYAPVRGWALGVAHKVSVSALLRALSGRLMLAFSVLGFAATLAAVLLYRRSHAVIGEMRFAKAYVNATFDAMPHAVLTLDENQQVRRANTAAGTLLGMAAPALIGQRLDALFEVSEAATADGTPQLATALRGDGRRRVVELTRRPLPFEGRNGSVLMMLDVEDQRRISESLRASEAGLAQAEKMAHLGHWRWTLNATTMRCSRQALSILGLPDGDSGELPVDAVLGRTHADDRRPLRTAIVGVLGGGPAAEIDLRIVRPDGTERLVHQMVCLHQEASGGAQHLMGTLLDITDSKLIEHELRSSRQALRELLANDESRLEEERKRIAREIHDELGQLLTALRMDVALLRLRSGEQVQTLDLARRMLAKIDETISVTRHVATHLRPGSLDLGLIAALEWLAEDMTHRYEVSCTVHREGAEPVVREEISIAAFRMVQECLTNVARHAHASVVVVHLSSNGPWLRIQVRDDGCGFDPQAPRPHGSFGLMGMRERALNAGGRLSIDSAPGRGTQVTIELPLD